MTTTTIYEAHTCQPPSNFFGVVPDGQVELCECGQKWRMKSGRVFYKWERMA
jgi:hypothetical protein